MLHQVTNEQESLVKDDTVLISSYFPVLWKNFVKSVQIRRFFWSAFSRIRTQYRPEKTPYLETFHAVKVITALTITYSLLVRLIKLF